MTYLRCLAITAAFAVFALCAPAFAQDTKTYDDAIARAVAEFDLGNWEEARALFRRAHEANPNARTWRSLGVTAFELRRYVDAIAELEAALADPRKPLTAKQREEVQGLLARAREFVSVYRVKVAPNDAEVVVDGKVVTLSEGKLFLDPGQHTVVVRAGGYEERRADLSVAAGVQDELSIELSVVGETTPEGPPPQAAPVEDPALDAGKPARRRVWTWVLGGSSLALAGAGLGTGLSARSKVNEYGKCETSCGAIRSKGERLQLVTNVTLAGSGALLVGAVIAFFLEGRSESASMTTLLLTPDSLGVSHRF